MPSPQEIARHAQDPATVRYRRDIDRAREEGRQEGRQEARKQVLDFLQEEYMGKEATRTNDYGRAILEVTRKLSMFLKNKENRR